MSIKFHINPASGAIGLCSANIQCPFGIPITEHFGSQQEAQKVYESSMSRTILKSFKSFKKPSASPSLDSYVDLELLNDMIRDGYVMQNRHPDDDSLSVLCYTRKVQFQGKWNDVTKKARGLIIQASADDLNDGVIVQRPWEKFFTISQIGSGWALGDEENTNSADNAISSIDFDAPAEVTDKMDGSMGVLYMSPTGRPAFATKGSFESEQALDYTRMMHQNEKMYEATNGLLQNSPDVTFVFELIGNYKHQVVLEYPGGEDASLIGAINKNTGTYLSVKDFDTQWKDRGLRSVTPMPATSLNEALNLSDRENSEGVVVRIISDDPKKQMQIKIKQDDYLKLHKSRTGFSRKDAKATLRDTKATLNDFIKVAISKDVSHFPEIAKTLEVEEGAGQQARLFNEMRRDFYNNTVLVRAESIHNAKSIVESLPDSHFEGADASKRFAETVKTLPGDKSLFFLLFNARKSGKNIGELNMQSEMRKASLMKEPNETDNNNLRKNKT